MVHLVSEVAFGRSMAIPDFPRGSARGLGLSDWEGYATRLAAQMDYTNTFFHAEPHLDITSVPDSLAHQFDFVVSTDVFEHVIAPVYRAFGGVKRLLKPGGALILSVPYVLESDVTIEHFPALHEFSVEKGKDGIYRLFNRRRDGVDEVFDNLIFHGGEGSTLEMRLFSRDSLLRELRDAGFRDVRIVDQPVPEFGIYWHCAWSLPMVAIA